MQIRLEDLLEVGGKELFQKNEIICAKFTSANFEDAVYSSFFTDSYVYMLVEKGCAEIIINNRQYSPQQYHIVVLTRLHTFEIESVSNNFECRLLFVKNSFLDVIPSMEKVFKHLNRSLKLYSNPVIKLADYELGLLSNCLLRLNSKIDNTGHFFHREIIQNAFIAFLLEWINIYEHHREQNPSEVDLNRSEQLLQSFITLLKTHFKEEHLVDFYAKELNVTNQYLSLIIKRLTGQTVNQFIYEMLYSEACILLNQSEYSVHEISEMLHFSDPSAFCKFFKRRSGVTPLKYRKV